MQRVFNTGFVFVGEGVEQIGQQVGSDYEFEECGVVTVSGAGLEAKKLAFLSSEPLFW